jgi:hypothetical protein
MKRHLSRVAGGFAVVLLLGVVCLSRFPFGTRADRGFDVTVAHPAYVGRHPSVLLDEAHFNAHTASGGFAPFVGLLRSDGYSVRRGRLAFSQDALRGVDVLVIANAAGGSNPKLFGFNLEPLRQGSREAPAFREAEIAAARGWVEGGGALLLVADHYPFGSAAAGLAAAFGVTMHGGFAEVSHQYPGQRDAAAIEYSRANGLLADHAIANGRSTEERVTCVRSFTGQSLTVGPERVLLALPPSAVEQVPAPPRFKSQPAGNAQGAAFDFGRGRVAVFGEAGMLTAQVTADGERFGMNVPGLDNRQLALNVMHWLSRLY